MGGLVGVLLVVLFSTTGCLSSFGGVPLSERDHPRFHDGHFENEVTTTVMSSSEPFPLRDYLFGSAMRVPNCPLPMVRDGATRLKTPSTSGLRVTWLGHSTTLVEIDGQVVLTDPMFSERASPSSAVGPKRFHAPPIALSELPHLDAVVISHDHYDHLDQATVVALVATGVSFHVGLGVGVHLAAWGVPAAQIVEHDWWGEVRVGELVIASVPARHFSGRRGVGNSRTLWTSWVLKSAKHRVFFSGDTGLHPALERIGKTYGPFDVAMLEIGQWHPSWGSIHLGPAGALKAAAMLGQPPVLPIHWSTFELGLHAWSEPAETLTLLAALQGVPVMTPRLGEPIEPTQSPVTGPWWRALPPIAENCPSVSTQQP